MARRKFARVRLSDLTQPISCRCATCGGDAKLFPYPFPKGSCICLSCSPPWLAAFVGDMSAKFAAEHPAEVA